MGHLSTLAYLRKHAAPRSCLAAYVKTVLHRKTAAGRASWRRSRAIQKTFRASLTSYRFSTDWFTGKIPFWLDAFDRAGLVDGEVNVLEIGSWEGLSSLFILETFPHARITCVDAWEGSRGVVGEGYQIELGVEERFDQNLEKHRGRLSKRRQTSLKYFASSEKGEQFDLIYVDGSHHGDDVAVDALECFARLKVGGVMIFDDYLAKYYEREEENPARAINLFLRAKQGRVELLAVYYQLILRKIA
jgi:predicted O-methyltransferase YrrM